MPEHVQFETAHYNFENSGPEPNRRQAPVAADALAAASGGPEISSPRQNKLTDAPARWTIGHRRGERIR
jgi:hypothetical protein